MSIARIAAGLGVSWHTVNDAVLATGHQLLIADLTRFEALEPALTATVGGHR
jgi:hypothetical protein